MTDPFGRLVRDIVHGVLSRHRAEEAGRRSERDSGRGGKRYRAPAGPTGYRMVDPRTPAPDTPTGWREWSDRHDNRNDNGGERRGSRLAAASETAAVVDGAAGTVTIDPVITHVWHLDCGGDVTIDLLPPPRRLRQTGSRVTLADQWTVQVWFTFPAPAAVSWPDHVQWPGGEPPTLTGGRPDAADVVPATDLVLVSTRDGGATWCGQLGARGLR